MAVHSRLSAQVPSLEKMPCGDGLSRVAQMVRPGPLSCRHSDMRVPSSSSVFLASPMPPCKIEREAAPSVSCTSCRSFLHQLELLWSIMLTAFLVCCRSD